MGFVMRKIQNRVAGFTLIELLIVIAVISILAVAFLPSLLNIPSKARDTERREVMNKIGNMLLLDYSEEGVIPRSGCWPESEKDNVLKMAYYINQNIVEFGGVWPQDPKRDTTAIPCAGMYAYYNVERAGSTWFAAWENSNVIFFVMAKVENRENGNIDLTAANWINIIASSDPLPLEDEGEYYMYALQK